MDNNQIEKSKQLVWLSYFGILLIIPLLTYKDNEYVKFHAKQGIILLICWIATSIITPLLSLVPVIGKMTIEGLYVFWFVLMVIGIVNSINGKTNLLPVIGKYAEKIRL